MKYDFKKGDLVKLRDYWLYASESPNFRYSNDGNEWFEFSKRVVLVFLGIDEEGLAIVLAGEQLCVISNDWLVPRDCVNV